MALSLLSFAAAGGVAYGVYNEILPFGALFTTVAAGSSAVLYFAAVVLLEYSIHRQRIRDSFFNADLRTQVRKLIPGLVVLAGFTLAAGIMLSLETLYGTEFSTIVFGLILGGVMLGILVLTVRGSIDLFDFQAGVIRRRVFPFVFFGVASLLALVTGALGSTEFYLPFILVHVAIAVRIYQEYFFARFIHLNDLFTRLQDSIRVRNELVDKIIHSPIEDDHKVVQGMFHDSLEAARSEAVLPQYGITGAVIYRRIGDELIVEHEEFTHGYCAPLYEVDTVRKLNREQLVRKIVDDRFNVRELLTHAETNPRRFGRKYMRSMLETKEPVKIKDIPSCYQGLIDLIVLYPVVDQEVITGCVVIYKDSFYEVFPQEDKGLRTFANNLSTVFNIMVGKQMQEERNRLQGEMDIAKNIQTSILPKTFSIPGYSIAASMETATEVGGDVYDWIPGKDGNYLAIGDVSGHGLPSGIMALIQMAAFQGAIKSADSKGSPLSPAELYNIVNEVLCLINRDRIGTDKFMTGNYFYQKDGRFEHAGAHEIALHYKAKEQKVYEIQDTVRRTGYLGISEYVDAKTSSGSFDMEAGDVLVLYTDGIIEAMDFTSEQFGIPRMAEILQQHAADEPEQIVAALQASVQDFAENGDLKKHDGSFADDITMMVIKRT